MNYFTPDLFARLQDPDPAAQDRTEAEWEEALQRYDQHLREREDLAPVLRRFEGLLLHDATVRGISRAGDRFVVVLQKDIPPRDVVTLTYTLAGKPYLDHEALPPGCRGGVMQFLYDEFDAIPVGGGGVVFTHSILFSNGGEVRLHFREVLVSVAQPIYPAADAGAALPAGMGGHCG